MCICTQRTVLASYTMELQHVRFFFLSKRKTKWRRDVCIQPSSWGVHVSPVQRYVTQLIKLRMRNLRKKRKRNRICERSVSLISCIILKEGDPNAKQKTIADATEKGIRTYKSIEELKIKGQKKQNKNKTQMHIY